MLHDVMPLLIEGFCRLYVTENVFANIVLQDDFEPGPPYRDNTRRVCDIIQRWWKYYE